MSRTLSVFLLVAFLGVAMSRTLDNRAAFKPAGISSERDSSAKDETATQALPQAWVAYGWAKHHDGHCSYKGYRSEYCPDTGIHFWDLLLKNPRGAPAPPAPSCAGDDQPCDPNATTPCCGLGYQCTLSTGSVFLCRNN